MQCWWFTAVNSGLPKRNRVQCRCARVSTWAHAPAAFVSHPVTPRTVVEWGLQAEVARLTSIDRFDGPKGVERTVCRGYE